MKNDIFEKLVTDGGRVVGEFDTDAFWKEISGEDVRVYGKKSVEDQGPFAAGSSENTCEIWISERVP